MTGPFCLKYEALHNIVWFRKEGRKEIVNTEQSLTKLFFVKERKKERMTLLVLEQNI